MKGQTNKLIAGGKLQRTLRKNMTEAERRLWQCLRKEQMRGMKFRRQHPFGDFVLDFVCLEARLVVEVDGGQHLERREIDLVRSRFLETAGFRVLRFWNHEVLRDPEAVASAVWEALGNPSPPRPSP